MTTWEGPVVDRGALRGRVVVAMSGGVDSSYVATLLHDEGYDVVGIAMRLYASAEAQGKSCCSPDDLRDAREVASAAGFPFYVANYQEAFRERVMAYFIDEYRRGRTPSPCVLCNDHLKFDVLLQRMEALGGAFLATGHYARVEETEEGRWRLLRGVDAAKDQSYFLFGLSRAVLPRLRFPLGGLTKAEVRERAETRGVPTATKAESQDICFVSGGHYAAFVEARLAPEERRPGIIRRFGTGEVLGGHEGIHQFTVGQRRGLGVAAAEPLYVHSLHADTGEVWVGTRDEVVFSSFRIERCNWLRWDVPPPTFEARVQVRYRHRPVAARLTRVSPDGAVMEVHLERSEPALAIGQAAVFYEGDEVLGGGWIEETR